MYLNYQKYQECQLVTAINVSTFFGFPPVEIDTNEYERLVDLVGARHGSAISIGRAHKYLKICRSESKFEPTWENITEKIKLGHPVELSVWYKKTGLHSVLVTDYSIDCTTGKSGRLIRTKYLKVLNFRHVTNENCMVKWNTLKKFTNPYPNNKNIHVCSYFYIDPLHRVNRFLGIKHKEKK